MEFSTPPVGPPSLPPQPPPLKLPEPRGPRLSTMAILSCVLSLIGLVMPFFFLIALIGIVFGHIAYYRIRKSDGNLRGKFWAIGALICGYLSIGISVIFAWGMFSLAKDHLETLDAPFDYVSNTPFFGRPLQTAERIQLGEVIAFQIETHGDRPGQDMQVRVYLPPGAEAAPAGSLPCVLVAPAGTNLLSGAELDRLSEMDYHDETLPYAQAGIVTVYYSIDGGANIEMIADEDSQIAAASGQYEAFKDAQAGVINGRHAVDFVRQTLPMVDPTQIYSAGHSSAGTLSLLLAMHEPRISGCIAYAPGVDIEAFHAELIETPFSGLVFSNVREFIRKSSPMNNVEKLHCPTFLFQSKEDYTVPYEEFQAFVEAIESRKNPPPLTIEIIEEGDHYFPMIEQGIPMGIAWIKQQSAH